MAPFSRIGREYDDLGRLEKLTSYENDDGTGAIRNQVVYSYQATGVIDKIWQSHDDVADIQSPGESPYVQYTDDISTTSGVYNDGLRIYQATYPDGSVVQFLRGGNHAYDNDDNIDDRLSRIDGLRFDPVGAVANFWFTEYEYNGTSRLAKIDYKAKYAQTEPKVHLEMFGSTANVYDRWDRFGRTLTHKWEDYTIGTVTLDQVDYTYDFVGNRLARDIPSSLYSTNDKDQVYAYDGLHRLKTFDSGTLSGTSISGTPASEQDYTLDQLGNWESFVEKIGGTTILNQTRLHNDVNEIDTDNSHSNGPGASLTSSVGTYWAYPKYDAAGNMTTMPKPNDITNGYTAKYDAWNRLVELKDGSTVKQANEYDGLNRRIIRDETGGSGVLTHFYYNQQWQVLEERVGTATTADKQYVYHPHYVDAVALRYDSNGDEHYFLHDANFNVTAVIDDTGSVVERYEYSPYGVVTVLHGSADADGAVTEWDKDSGGSDIDNEYLYTGRRLDPETGLQLNRNRFYASHLGRWVNRDPIEYKARGKNLYEYVGSGPTFYVDPQGLDRTVCFFGHAWIEVDIYDDCCEKIGTKQLHFSPYGYTVDLDCIYPSWICVTIESSCEEDKILLESWEDKGRRELSCSCDRDLWHWNPVNNCCLQTLGGMTCGIEPKPREPWDYPGRPPELGTGPIYCFVEGTLVSTSDGKTSIEKLCVGDAVTSYSFTEEKSVESTVTRIHSRLASHVICILTNDGPEEIVVTLEHPFYVEGKGWIKAGNLSIGDSLRTLDGKTVAISTLHKKDEEHTVYNITVDQQHNYFVGEKGILVHNK